MWRTLALAGVVLAAAPECWADSATARSAFERGDFATAFREWSSLGATGDASALLNVGLLYDTGHGVPQNFPAALDFYRRAAAAGNATAAFNVGVMYDVGRGVSVDRQEAARWYQMAARMGFGRAEYNLAMMYEHGDGVRKDLAVAKKLYQAADKHGIYAAAGKLQLLLGAVKRGNENGGFGRAEALILARGLAKAGGDVVNELMTAAQRGDARAQYDLGYCYEYGIGLSADKLKAFVWYSRAAGGLPRTRVQEAAAQNANEIQSHLTPPERQAAAIVLRQLSH